jgi:N-ethylmaleimide reductase
MSNANKGYNQPLLQPARMGKIELKNRVVMAPLTRMRASNPDNAPTNLHVDYYQQRASAGLIVSEGAAISPQGYGWHGTPGLWSAPQLRGWQKVTDAVHDAGGRIVAQLWHTGAISHPDLQGGTQAVAPSGVNVGHESVTPTGRVPTVDPRPMTLQDIRAAVADYGRAARNAVQAGFDGVQIQANYLYLIAQFLNKGTNRRTDGYGGPPEARARFLFEVVESVLKEVEPGRVGVKIGPMHEGGPFAANEETLPITEHAVRELDRYGLSHILMMGNLNDFSGTPLEGLAGDGMFEHFRPLVSGSFIANSNMDRERANRLLAAGTADLVAFGRPYIANPDLVERFAAGALLSEPDWPTVYGDGARGYTDYPALEQALAAA